MDERFDGYTIIASEKYKRYKDILAVLLDDDMTYTHEEIDEILQNEFNRPIRRYRYGIRWRNILVP